MITFKIILLVIVFIVIGYIFGNILFGPIFGLIFKKNVRNMGSHNIGATNISRSLGMHIGLMVALLDATKSYVAVVICWIIFYYSIYQWVPSNQYLYCTIYLAGIFAVMGHCFPIIYITELFKTNFDLEKAKVKSGGKGAASTAGIMAAISPWILLIAFTMWLIVLLSTHYVSVSSITCIFLSAFAIFIPHIAYIYLFNNSILFQNKNFPNIIEKVLLLVIMLCDSFIVTIRHTQNIKQLINKTEKRFF